MSLFGRTKEDKQAKEPVENTRNQIVFGDLSGLSVPFKKAEKNDISRKLITQELDKYKNLPVRLLQETSNILKKLNRLLMKPEQRKELTDMLASYVYPVVSLWYEKYQNEENSLPESNERRNSLTCSIEAVQQLSIAYKLLFREFYVENNKEFKKNQSQIYFYAARSLELIRLEQRLRALRYQKLPKISWQHCNQLFFPLIHHNFVDEDYELIGLIGIKKGSDKLRLGGVPKSSIRKIYLSIQLFGLLDVTTWPTRMFHVPDGYLDFLGDGIKILADDGKELKPGFLLTHYKNDLPPLFKRSTHLPSPLIRLDYTNLYNTLVKDHREIGKQQFLEEIDATKFSRPLIDIAEVDRVPVIELIIMGLTSRERRQKRHALFDGSALSVYFGFHDVNRLLQDLIAPDQERVKESRQFIDTLAMSSALLAEEQATHMAKSWTITNFSAGGLLISTEENDFSNPIQIDMLMAFTMHDNKKEPILGFVRRLNRPSEKQVEVAIVRLSNYAEAAGVQAQDEIDTAVGKAAILIKDVRGEWNLIIKTSMPYVKGQPLKLIRANGARLPVRLGDAVYTKKDFKVYQLRSPGLEAEKTK